MKNIKTLVIVAIAIAITASSAATASAAPERRVERQDNEQAKNVTSSIRLTGSTTAARNQESRESKESKKINQITEELQGDIEQVSQIRNLTSAQKQSITATVQGVISALGQLKTRLAEDVASTTALKTDRENLAQVVSINGLLMPQIRVIIASDKVVTVVNDMTLVRAKILERFAIASTTLSTSVQNALKDLDAKLESANKKAQSAANNVYNLSPDMGDKTKKAANNKALKDARSIVQDAKKDLVAARKDIQTAIKALPKGERGGIMNPNTTNTSATSSTR